MSPGPRDGIVEVARSWRAASLRVTAARATLRETRAFLGLWAEIGAYSRLSDEVASRQIAPYVCPELARGSVPNGRQRTVTTGAMRGLDSVGALVVELVGRGRGARFRVTCPTVGEETHYAEGCDSAGNALLPDTK